MLIYSVGAAPVADDHSSPFCLALGDWLPFFLCVIWSAPIRLFLFWSPLISFFFCLEFSSDCLTLLFVFLWHVQRILACFPHILISFLLSSLFNFSWGLHLLLLAVWGICCIFIPKCSSFAYDFCKHLIFFTKNALCTYLWLTAHNLWHS